MNALPSLILVKSSEELGDGDRHQLISPYQAIVWVGTGKLGGALLLPRPWNECLDDYNELEIEKENDRIQLAEEIVVAAIVSGRLHCAWVSEISESRGWAASPLQLTIADPKQFEMGAVNFEWDNDGLNLIIDAKNGSGPVHISEFMFLWSEVQALRHRRAAAEIRSLVEVESERSVRLATVPEALSRPPEPRPAAQLTSIPMLPFHTSGHRGRGRPSGKNGEPIAMFVLRAQAEGVQKLNSLSDDALGAMLAEEYIHLGLKTPENSNAAKDARGAIRALVKMQAAIERRAAE